MGRGIECMRTEIVCLPTGVACMATGIVCIRGGIACLGAGIACRHNLLAIKRLIHTILGATQSDLGDLRQFHDKQLPLLVCNHQRIDAVPANRLALFRIAQLHPADGL